jgi:hypothetical protein
MSLMSDRSVKKKDKPLESVAPAATVKEDPLAGVAVTVEEFQAEHSPAEVLDVTVAQNFMGDTTPDDIKMPVVEAPRTRVRVLQSAKVIIGGYPCRFTAGDVLDANVYSNSGFREILNQVRTEPVT